MEYFCNFALKMSTITPTYCPHISQTRTRCPHTYGVRVCSCAALATEPCRLTACISLAQPPAVPCPLPPVRWTFTFSAKEKDTETGYSYFGSRYYSSDLSIWLSVDPMSDKYPSLSPYVYCANNPIKLVDPNGEDYEVVVEGNTITIKATYYTNSENYDRVNQGVQVWNSQSGLYEFTSDEGKTYSVVFDLKVKKCKTTNDTPKSRGSWNWVTTMDLDEYTRGESNGYSINLDNDIIKAPTRTVAHEMGHTLGILDVDCGIMESGGISDQILDEHIMTILKGAGIQSTNGSSYNEDCYCPINEKANCVGKYNMNGSFRRKDQ